MATKKKKKTAATSTCFVITPFGGWLDIYYGSIFKPAIECCRLKAQRADDLFRPSTIVHDIWSYTRDAKILLADLTGKNANVFYELGLAHALAKPVIMVAESLDDVPFDLRALRIITYDKNAPDWGSILRDKIKSSIKEVLRAPTSAVLPAFLNLRDTGKPTVTPQEKEVIELRQEVDSLRRDVEIRRQHELRLDDPRPEPDVAREMIRLYLSRGMPLPMIEDRLVARGVPRGWVRGEIDAARSELRPRELIRSVHAARTPSRRRAAAKSTTTRKRTRKKAA